MRYFHCPTTFNGKPYGCGAGPYNGTQACLDMWGDCRCGKKLKPYKPRRVPPKGDMCQVTGIDGARYCTARVVEGVYCARHKYLNHSTGVMV